MPLPQRAALLDVVKSFPQPMYIGKRTIHHRLTQAARQRLAAPVDVEPATDALTPALTGHTGVHDRTIQPLPSQIHPWLPRRSCARLRKRHPR
jgi:hypothetical protein